MSKSPKSPKSKKHSSDVIELDFEVKKSKKKGIKKESIDVEDEVIYENNNEIKSKKVKSPDRKKDKVIASNNLKDANDSKDASIQIDETINWPEKDLVELFNRIEAAIPPKDTLVYSTRVEKISWQEIAFNDYDGDECKRVWFLVQKRLRKYRLLSEVLTDAKTWLTKPWTNFYKGGKSNRHPDQPRRPLTSYMLFYMKKKSKVQAEYPNLEMPELSKRIAAMYKTLPQSKKQKYEKMAAEKRREYEEKIEEFHRLHPEIPRTAEKQSTNKAGMDDAGIKKPSTPFHLFYLSQLEKHGKSDKVSFKEECKARWKSMSDKKKVIWIDWALEEEAKYKEALSNYRLQNPNYVPSAMKPVLTKEEKFLKERLAGKPTKPPMSAYSLFSRLLLKSEEIKQISAKDRMNYIATQWKNCSDEEKKCYREKVAHLLEQYKLEYASYLESLPEEKRDEELQNNLPKRKSKKSKEGNIPKRRKISNDIFKSEPVKPPKTPFQLFCKMYEGKMAPDDVWNKMSKNEQRKYEVELDTMKTIYLSEFKKFLESLDKKQLKKFADMRKNRRSSEDEEESQDDVNNDNSAYSSEEDSS